MKKLIVWIVVLGVLGTGGYFAYEKYGKVEVKPQITEATVTRGSIAETVAATGTLTAVRTIDIGTQVSGTVKKLYADFNDIVKQGDLLAELDPSLLQTQVDMQNANLQRADVDINQRQITLENDLKKLERQRELFAKQLVTQEALDQSELQVKLDRANIESSKASRVQTLASLEQAKKNVEYTKIYAPIDGVITVRITDEGRTVNASTSSPSLYTMATDLTKMLLTASIDEAEVSKVREGQTVSFRVDAYAGAMFYGTVKQVRLNAKNSQNVVTYETVVDVNNPDFRLKPGMTATLNVEVQRADDVLRVPAAALRFRPTTEMFDLIKQPVPPEAQPNTGRGATGGRRGADAGGAAGAAGAQVPGSTGAQVPGAAGATKAPDAKATTPATGVDRQRGGNATGGQQATAGQTGGRGGNFAGGNNQGGRGGGRNMNITPEQQKKLDEIRNNQKLTPEERRAEMAKVFGGNNPFGGGRGQGGGRNGGTQGSGVGMAQRGAETVDQLLPPVQRRELRNQRVWLWIAGANGMGQLKPVNGLTTGVSDGQFTELVSGELKEGDKVVTNFVIPGAKVNTATPQQGNPFQQNQGRGGPGGGRGGF
ncbi:MAG: efflux RND transporter periplasmic adaptor subunit [Acidobacteria bacterium]|nr:MAG: efflux RND transporter periplasmic adaptor subunit [Acidobacteriota bacterium]